MKEKKYLIGILLLLYINFFICPQSTVMIALTDDSAMIPVEKYLFISTESAVERLINDAAGKDYPSIFKPLSGINNNRKKINYDNVWFKFKLVNQSANNDWILWDDAFSYADKDKYECYAVVNENITSLENQVVVCSKKAYKITLNRNETVTFYIHYKYNVNVLDLQILNLKTFIKKNNYESLFYGIISGIMVLIIFYNFFIFFSIRDINYIYYCIFVTAFALLILLSGFFSLYLNNLKYYDQLYRNLQLISGLSFLIFAKKFLNARAYAFVFNKILNIFLLVVLILSLFFNIFYRYVSPILSIFIFSVILIILIIVISLEIFVFIKGYFAAIFFISATILLTAVGILYCLAGFALLPDSFSRYLLKIKALESSSLVMIFLFSFGLSYRIRSIRKDKETMQQLAVENIKKADQLTETNRLLKETSELKSNLIKIAAHDLRTPLTLINMYTGKLKKNIRDDIALNTIDKIKNSSDKMVVLIDEILENAQLNDGKILLVKEPIEVTVFFTRLVNEFDEIAGSKNQEIIMDTDLQKNLFINGDRGRLEEIFRNLISNAVKFSPPASKIRMMIKKENHSLMIAITDEGPGFTDQDKEKIFKEYQKLSARPTGNESSFGLGLSITKKLIDLHGGLIQVESVYGQGASLIVRLPCQPADIP